MINAAKSLLINTANVTHRRRGMQTAERWLCLLLLAILVVTPALAADQHDAQTDAEWTLAEVRKVDLEQGRLTLRHERIESLNMDAMTMVFRLGEGVTAEGLEEGAKIRFQVKRDMGRMVLTAIEQVP